MRCERWPSGEGEHFLPTFSQSAWPKGRAAAKPFVLEIQGPERRVTARLSDQPRGGNAH